MTDKFNIYKNEKIIQSGKSPMKIEGLSPDTLYKKGIFKISRVFNAGESEKVDVPEFKTSSIEVQSVTLDKNKLSMIVGDTYKLTATIAPENATDKTETWSTGNSTITRVDASKGNVVAVGAGQARITVKVGKQTAFCDITVTEG